MACDPPRDISLTPLTPVGTFYTDTLTVRTSTVLADSVRTSNPDILLMGKYKDPLFGEITASSHFWVNTPATTAVEFGTTARYDSLVLLMGYSYTYGDTIPTQKLAVHRITEDLSRTTTYYNTSKVAYAATPLGEKTFLARPSTTGTMRVRLSDNLGSELFTLLSTPANQTNDKIHSVLKGLALVPGEDNTAIIGIPGSNGVLLQLYYRSSPTDTVTKAYSLGAHLNLNTGPYRAGFNRVIADRTGTPLEDIKPLQPIPASATNGYTYVQDALGVMTRIEIPYLNRLRANGPAAINRAQLTIRPDLSFNQPGITIPPFLVLLETDSTNLIKRNAGYELIVNSDVSGHSNTPIDPQVQPYNPLTKDYTFFLTTQLQAILSGRKTNNSFLLTPIYTNTLGQTGTRFESQLNNRVNRLVVGTKPGDLKLIVFYTVAKE
ncbi:DUF4270 family protein [Telluribacter sp. SYSU D00476]|uniref:DUF4270 family protein n=1 Tax=Telluribacter sp. SYSU D00476 TaxID=2811430 RepID=UPI001FF4DD5D|nr:DUF4270 family protein [Telluribacter sp. SYSU D00476]